MKRLLLPFALLVAACGGGEPYDLVIVGGQVLDGTGSPPYAADVGVRGDRIARIGEGLDTTGARVVDATGLIVAPGFVDVHAHLDPLHRLPGAESHVRQGVTTALGGPDGGGPLPLGGYLDETEEMGVGINVAMLVGHNSIRREVMGMENRAPTDQEMERMRSMVAGAMEAGAFGI